ncbi:MAG: N-formylglutamate amidohydrolase [Sphingomicrobium sp.]
MDRSPLPPPDILPHRSPLPVALSVPHSGRDFPDWLLTMASGGREALESLADPLVDRLAWRAISAGHGAVVARAPRAALDCNRSPDDIDPAVITGPFQANPTPRAKAGLGVVPDRTARHGRLWKHKLSRIDLERRIDEAHAPYHRAIEQALDRLSIKHGQTLLLDCHSMPNRRGQAELVIGDRHGRSAAQWLSSEAARIARAQGWVVAVNDPYAGGFIVERHGEPDKGRHALQLEICRATYLDHAGSAPGPGFDRAARLIETIARELGAAMLPVHVIAAE